MILDSAFNIGNRCGLAYVIVDGQKNLVNEGGYENYGFEFNVKPGASAHLYLLINNIPKTPGQYMLGINFYLDDNMFEQQFVITE